MLRYLCIPCTEVPVLRGHIILVHIIGGQYITGTDYRVLFIRAYYWLLQIVQPFYWLQQLFNGGRIWYIFIASMLHQNTRLERCARASYWLIHWLKDLKDSHWLVEKIQNLIGCWCFRTLIGDFSELISYLADVYQLGSAVI